MRSRNDLLKNAVTKISGDSAEALVKRVLELADTDIVVSGDRLKLFFQLEPFAREFSEFQINHQLEEVTVLSKWLSYIRHNKGTKRRATLFAWLSYYHPTDAENFRNEVLKNENIFIHHYLGYPNVDSKLSDQAHAVFTHNPSRTIDEERELKLATEGKKEKSPLRINKRLALYATASAFIAIFVFYAFAQYKSFRLESSPNAFSRYWVDRDLGTLSFDEADFVQKEAIFRRGRIRMPRGLSNVKSYQLTGHDVFTFTGGLREDTLTSQGVEVKFDFLNGTYLGKSGHANVLELSIDDQGFFEASLFSGVDHDEVENSPNPINIEFGVTATLKSGEKVDGGKFSIKIMDSAPDVFATFCKFFEYNMLKGRNSLSGQMTRENGSYVNSRLNEKTYFHFTDEVNIYDKYYKQKWRRKNIDLTSNGRAVEIVRLNPQQYHGLVEGNLVFVVKLERANGKYSYRQFEDLDQPANGDQYIVLSFGVHAHDGDGGPSETELQFDIYDAVHVPSTPIVNGLSAFH